MAHDDIEKLLAEEKALQERKKAAAEVLQREMDEALKEHDRKRDDIVKSYKARLVQLGVDGVKPKRSHHKKAAPAAEAKSPKG